MFQTCDDARSGNVLRELRIAGEWGDGDARRGEIGLIVIRGDGDVRRGEIGLIVSRGDGDGRYVGIKWCVEGRHLLTEDGLGIFDDPQIIKLGYRGATD